MTQRPFRHLRFVCLLLPALLLASPVGGPQAFAQATSSGGYTRPGGSTSGSGYAAPPSRRPSVAPPPSYAPSASDRAISRRSSSSAYEDYRRPPPPPRSANPWGSAASPPPQRPPGYAPPSYAPPNYAPQPGGYGGAIPSWASPQQRFGPFEAAALFAMLNALTNTANRDFFRQNQNDPAIRAWRNQVEQAAQSDPTLQSRLNELNSVMRQATGSATQPSPYAPPPSAVVPPVPPQPSGGGGIVWLLLFFGIGAFILLWLARRRAAQATQPTG